MTTKRHLTEEVDALTGLQRSYAFLNLLCEMAQEKKQCEVMILGIDNFKTINNLYTYSFGDQVLQRLANELRDLLPPAAQLFRLDGDNFGVVCAGEPHQQCEQIYANVSQQYQHIEGISISFSVSAGICHCPTYGEDGDTLYANVCLALAQAKAGTKNSCYYYTPEISERIKQDMFLLERLRGSIVDHFKGFYLEYQPIFKSDTKTLYGCEALLRFKDEAFPAGVSPYQFVPLLERSGLILEVGRWVIRNAVFQCAKWRKVDSDFCMNINISASQLDDIGFAEFIIETLSEYDLSPGAIVLELTESEHASFDKIRNFFDYMRKHGFQTALDDFGTGYASLDIFRQVSADELKIDRSFLERITDNVTDQILLESILSMCRKMNIGVCVEGIENEDMENIVSQMNPQLLQGFQYSRPISAQELEQQYLKGSIAQNDQTAEQSPLVYAQYRPAKPMTYSEILNNAHSGIFQVGMDTEFSFLTCNEGYRRMLGYTAREMEEKFGNKALGFVHPDDTAWVNEEIRNQLAQGDTVNIEFRVVRADGRPIWILGTGNVVKTSDGNPSLIVNIIENDKRKRKNMQNEAALSRYERILSLLPTGIKYIRYDPDFTIEYISPGFLSIMGYTQQDIDERFDGKYINLIYEEDRQKVFNDALDQVQKSDVVHLHYRSVCKDGRILWMETISRLCPVDPDGIQRCCSSVVNVTETITKEEKSRSLNISNRLQKAAQTWGEILFEYNFLTEQLVVSESFSSMFGYELPETGMVEPELIFGEEKNSFLGLLEQAHDGKNPAPIELPASRANGQRIWCRILAHPSEQIGGEQVSVIGKFIDIDEEYREREKLRLASQTDSLTELYNKGAVEIRIASMIKENPDIAYNCWVLDVDDFKIVNDTLGHFAGDKLLQTIAKRLIACFRKTDIVGRIGGDEFLVFAAGVSDENWQRQKGDQLLKLLKEPIILNGQEIIPALSIGVACYPKDGSSFSELYQNADKALYRAKASGKNKLCFF